MRTAGDGVAVGIRDTGEDAPRIVGIVSDYVTGGIIFILRLINIDGGREMTNAL